MSGPEYRGAITEFGAVGYLDPQSIPRFDGGGHVPVDGGTAGAHGGGTATATVENERISWTDRTRPRRHDSDERVTVINSGDRAADVPLDGRWRVIDGSGAGG